MTPKINLEIKQGATFRHSFRWEDENGVAINLTGWSGRMEVRELQSSPNVLIKFSSDLTDTTRHGDITFDVLNGGVNLKLSHTFTTLLAWTNLNAVYDLELIDGNGDVTRFAEGRITLSLEVTRGQ